MNNRTQINLIKKIKKNNFLFPIHCKILYYNYYDLKVHIFKPQVCTLKDLGVYH